MKKVSIIIPTYNEIRNIESLITRLRDSFAKLKVPYEVIFIDDHSSDGTFEGLKNNKHENIRVYAKAGKQGKSYSLIEGFMQAKGDVLVMLDSDLQYPPEAIPYMLEKLRDFDLIVADREKYYDSKIRRVLSVGFRTLFGKFAFQLNHDIQSGLKVFKREVWQTVAFEPKSPWTFDLAFLHKAREAGYRVGSYPISFFPRRSGVSKMRFIHQTFEIGLNAVAVRFMRIHPQRIAPYEHKSMLGAGVGYRSKQYITHTTLPSHISAMRTVHASQMLMLVLVLFITGTLLFLHPLGTVQTLIGILSFVYFVDVFFNLFVVVRSLGYSSETKDLHIDPHINDASLPVYSILCPLYREVAVVPQFINSLEKLDWPKDKLDVILLLEEDDDETIQHLRHVMSLPSFVRVVTVPVSIPKTKPKACNFGLGIAKGEYLVVYDAEDIPEPLQLKKAYIAFQTLPRDVVCLQAKLNYYNPKQNILTRFFTAEYSLWFDVTLTGLQSIGTAIPLGGTSNHFRTEDLRALEGWDPFNVTEDADLGIRLFKRGYKTAIIDSTTFEEANSHPFNWLRQRSRWIKGYMQTYLVHMRNPIEFIKKQGIHSLFFQLIVGGKIVFILINPFLWITTIAYFSLNGLFGSAIESVYPPAVFYLAVIPLVFGNFLFLYYYMIGCAKRGQWDLIKYVYLVPFYWLMISLAGTIALWQLIFKPHYWEKTIHGLHLKKRQAMVIPQLIIESESSKAGGIVFPRHFRERLAIVYANRKKILSGSALVIASIVANILNLAFNVYLGRVLDYSMLGLIGLIGSLSYLSTVPFNAIATTVNYRSSYLDGKYGPASAIAFWRYIRRRVFFVGITVSLVWIAISPLIAQYFQSTSLNPFLLFLPIWIVGFAASVDRGFLFGRIMFASLAFVSIIEPVAKFGLAALLVTAGLPQYVVASIPISIVVAFFAGWMLARKSIKKLPVKSDSKTAHKFPFTFFGGSILLSLGTVSFLSFDVLLAKHYLSATESGQYVLLSLIGKVIFFLGSLSTQFVVTLTGRKEAKKQNTLRTFYYILLATSVLSSFGFLTFALFGNFITPLLFGKKALAIVPYLPVFGFGVLCFTLSRVFISYYLTKKLYSFPLVSFLFVFLQYSLLAKNHAGIDAFATVMAIVGGSTFVTVVAMHLSVRSIRRIEDVISEFLGLFTQLPIDVNDAKLRILLFNWRDTKHVWAGGAETYIHEIAKRWVKSGVEVVLFCGNDYRHAKDEVVEGVRVIRRGGHYTVYIFAILYYVIKLRKKFDLVVDCENGIPFFTPLYVRKPVFLLIHHMHQEVFAEHLRFPFSKIAMFLEGKLMPLVYKNNQIITVSESSKRQIVQLKIAKASDVHVVNPGINDEHLARSEKYPQPTFLYLGRLKSYKNIDIAVQAFALVQQAYSKARLFIVGTGEQTGSLKKLVEKLHIDASVYFFGFVNEETKAELLAKSWAVLHPSMMEGWAISVIEANASGTPVIASNANGLKDSIVNGSTGILVDVGDAEKMARAMVDIVIDKKYRTVLSTQAYIWSKHFSWEKSASEFYGIFTQTLSESHKKIRAQGFLFTNE